jgi:hypothetical protein
MSISLLLDHKLSLFFEYLKNEQISWDVCFHNQKIIFLSEINEYKRLKFHFLDIISHGNLYDKTLCHPRMRRCFSNNWQVRCTHWRICPYYKYRRVWTLFYISIVEYIHLILFFCVLLFTALPHSVKYTEERKCNNIHDVILYWK